MQVIGGRPAAAPPARPAGRVAIVTESDAPAVTADDALALGCLPAGISWTATPWDRPDVAWSTFDAVILRSCWTYYRRPEAFLGWVGSLAPVPVWNPPALVRWNWQKTYLRELAAAGVPTVPTVWLPRGEPASLRRVLNEAGWTRAVVKPTVGATSFRTWRTTLAAAAAEQPLLDELLADSGALVQPYLPEVESAGELSLVFFAGRYSHAVRKLPRPGDFRVQSQLGGTVAAARPGRAALAAARRILRLLPSTPLYARVDGIVTAAYGFLLMELELIEPVLFFATCPEAPRRFAAAVAERILASRGAMPAIVEPARAPPPPRAAEGAEAPLSDR